MKDLKIIPKAPKLDPLPVIIVIDPLDPWPAPEPSPNMNDLPPVLCPNPIPVGGSVGVGLPGGQQHMCFDNKLQKPVPCPRAWLKKYGHQIKNDKKPHLPLMCMDKKAKKPVPCPRTWLKKHYNVVRKYMTEIGGKSANKVAVNV